MDKPNDSMISLAAEKLGVDFDAARASARAADGIEDAFFFTRGTRGGGRLIVTANLETLFAASSIPLQDHIRAFLQGRRS